MQKAYQGAPQGGNCGQEYANTNNQSYAGPSTDEVDWDFLWSFFFILLNQFSKSINIFISFDSINKTHKKIKI